jgi:threonine synthase
MTVHRGVLIRWAEYLPLTKDTPALSLGEGETPLVSAPRLAAALGCEELWLKCEGMNPTGSFKDRGMVVAMAKAIESGAKIAVCASTGNTSASAAAYCAAAGIACRVVVPEGKVSLGKLSQALMHGARLIVLKGNFDAALTAVRKMAERLPIALVNSVNPFRLEGQKTAAFEVIEALGRVPDGLALPVGNAGNISAYWKGFTEHAAREVKAGRAARTPVIYGVQAAGAAPFLSGAPVAHPETIATAIRIGNPASWEILSAQKRLASEAGVFCEPASAAPIAGLLKLQARSPGRFKGQTLVAVLTGHGLKDPQTAIADAPPLPEPIENNLESLTEALS